MLRVYEHEEVELLADEGQVTVRSSTENETDSETPSSREESADPGNAFDASAPVESCDHEDGRPTDGPDATTPVISTARNWQSDIATSLVEMRDALTGLRRDFESKLMYDAGKQRQLDVLHEELETYRRGFHLQLLRPVITDLITLYGDMEKVAARLATQEAHAAAAQEIVHFQDQVEEILRRNNVERYTAQGDQFDAGRQRAITAVETTDPSKDKCVAERIRPGFEYEGKIVVQAEQVKTYRYVPSVETSGDAK